MQFLLIYRTEEDRKSQAPPCQEKMPAMAPLLQELGKAGVVLSAGGLDHSAKGSRVRRSGKKVIVTDGPFTEAKELIAGYVLVQVESREAAIEVAQRFLRAAGGGESEIREVLGAP